MTPRTASGPGWLDLIDDHMDSIYADFLEVYRIDLDADDLSWHGFTARIVGLLTRPPALTPVPETGQVFVAPSTRLGVALNPPSFVGGSQG